MLPASCKLVEDIVKCPGRFNSEPGLRYRQAPKRPRFARASTHVFHSSFARDNDVVPLPVFGGRKIIVPPEVPQKVASVVVANHRHYLLDAQ